MNYIKNIYLKIINIKSDFQKLFFEKEYLALTEEFGVNFHTVFSILLLTFFAFSFSIGSIDYLEKKMKDPFTNWIDVPVTMKVKPMRHKIESYFNKADVKKSIYLDNISEYSIFFRNFYNDKLNEVYQLKGRTMSDTSSLLNKIIDTKNIVSDNTEENIKEQFLNCGVIINDDALEELNFDNAPKFIFLKIDEAAIYLPIAAVVKDLPENTDFLVTNRLYNLTKSVYSSGMIVRQQTGNIIKILSDEKLSDSFYEMMKKTGFKVEDSSLDEEIFKDNGKYKYTIIMSKPYEWEKLSKSVNKLIDDSKIKAVLFWDNECISDYTSQISSPHRLAFNFNDLTKIRDFNTMMKNQFEIEVNMSQIESKENFSLVAKLTFILGLILLIFSLISIIFFINSVLTKHLQKIKANIGTFKAFGVDNKSLNKIYIKIILTFILVAGVLAYVVNAFLSIIVNLIIGLKILKFYSIYILFIFLIIVSISLFFSNKSILRVLKNSPGNLIYNRI